MASHLKKHGLNSIADHDLTGLSQSGLVMANLENGGSITTVLPESIASGSIKKVTYTTAIEASLFANWNDGDHGIAQKSDGSEIFHCYKKNNRVYAVEMCVLDV